MNEEISVILSNIIAVIAVIMLGIVIDLIVKRLFLRIVKAYAAKSNHKWDDILLKNKVFDQLVDIIPGVVIYGFAPVFPEIESHPCHLLIPSAMPTLLK